MKRSMFGRSMVAASLSLCTLAGATMAQQGELPPEVRARLVSRGGADPTDTTKLSVEFAGGSLEEFVRALRKSTEDPVNISLQGDAAKVHVEPLMLRDVSVSAAMQAALGSRPNQNVLEADGSMTQTTTQMIDPSDSGKPVIVVTTRRAPGGGPGKSDMSVEVLSIRSLVQAEGGKGSAVPEQVVLSAIDSGLKLLGTTEGVKPQIDYHKDSGLLLVRGQSRDVGLVTEIVRRMTDDQKKRAAENRERTRAEIERTADMQRAEIAMELAASRASEQQKRLDESQKMVAAGTGSTRELADARMAFLQATAEVNMAKVEIDKLRKEAAAGVEGGSGPAGDEVSQLRAELAKALERIRELEDKAAAGKGGERGGDKPAPKGR